MSPVQVWYHVRDLEAGRAFYTDKLGFAETFVDEEGRWARLMHGEMEIAIAEGEPQGETGVATVDVADIKSEAERLRTEGVEVGTVLELHGQMRLLDVYDPDGNRIQLAEEVSRQP
ncbi:MAG TPA: VOC family protein [Gaiellaceae bacterium]|nr:VOC family protein [Gaiellaceae bacterium]